MRDAPELRRLAGQLGILLRYRAADGAVRETSAATCAQLLAAMGVPVADEGQARRALAARRAAQRARLVAPTQVASAGSQVCVTVRGAAPAQVAVLDGAGGVVAQRDAQGGVAVFPDLPAGVYRARVVVARRRRGGVTAAEQALLVAPPSARDAAGALGDARGVGVWANLYSLRREGDAGIGDLTAARELAEAAGRAGAAFLGLSPLHACRNRGLEVSPYSGTSRIFRNAIYLDVEQVPEFATCDEARALWAAPAQRERLGQLRAAARIDYAAVAAARLPVLVALHEAFRRGRGARAEYRAFLARDDGLPLDFATFCALEEDLAATGSPRDWRAWPEQLHDPDGAAVRSFRARRSREVDFHAFLQFELERQLGVCAAAARSAGMALGLYQDIALGALASGFDAWRFGELIVTQVSLGAPPDAYAQDGQDWGIPPLEPRRLGNDGFRYLRAVLRSACEHSGAVRVDHAMGLQRQWWVPGGSSAGEGAYVRYPVDALFALLAIASHEHDCVFIGEDLGTVPAGFRRRMTRAGALSSRVLLFERGKRGAFRAPSRWSRHALATANTHDLPPLHAWWSGADLELRRDLGILASDEALTAARLERADDRAALLRRLRAERLLGRAEPDAAALTVAVHAFLLRTPAVLVGWSLDDLAGEVVPVNLPGVPQRVYPSWTRRMQRDVAALAARLASQRSA